MRRRDKAPNPKYSYRKTAFHLGSNRNLQRAFLLQSFLQAVPGNLFISATLRQKYLAVLIICVQHVNINLFAIFHQVRSLGRCGISQFFQRNNAFRLIADINKHFITANSYDGSFNHHAPFNFLRCLGQHFVKILHFPANLLNNPIRR